MRLITCGAKAAGGGLGHPCGKAARALERAGVEFVLETVRGFKNVPFSIRGDDRAEIEALTGQRYVPVLVLPDGAAIAGSDEIVAWADARA